MLLAFMKACGVDRGVSGEEMREEREDDDDALELWL